MNRRQLILSQVMAFFFMTALSGQSISEVVGVTGGQIKGVAHQSSGVHIFKGIPFAAPPVGDLRWKAPQPVMPWDGVKSCTEFGPSPMQAKPSPFMFWSSEFLIPEDPISEDCLYLNVWTNAQSQSDKKPVLVYIYGGGFRSGGSACPIYDGLSLAEKDVVFVSVNYRVGMFGFFAHPDLSSEAEYGTSGNYGILDMIAALKWVKENIATFGGDPDNVTIAGQSAGAYGVNFLTASPLAKGLFHKVIAQSGASFYENRRRPNLTLETAEQMGLEIAASIDELRGKSSEELMQLSNALSWPLVDGYLLPKSIYEIFNSGEQNDVPTIVGWNDRDVLMGPPVERDAFLARISERFEDKTSDFNRVYATDTKEESDRAQLEMNRDESFGIQIYAWAKLQDKTGKEPVYMYNFNRDLPAYTPETAFGAFHSGEIVYAYDNLEKLKRPWEDVDHTIADLMSGYWTSFIKDGNPNADGLPEWKPFSVEHQYVQSISEDTRCEILPTKEKLLFWEAIYMN